MPAMVRWNSKATKIAYKLVGKPANMEKPSAKEAWIDRRLLYEETFRAR